MWKNQYHKAVTFSFDDGVTQDKRLAEMLNRYHLKATFNVNTALNSSTPAFEDEGIWIKHLNHEELKRVLFGHEIAVHGHVHADLRQLSQDEIVEEIVHNRLEIHRIYGKMPIGMAYAFGGFDERVEQVISTLPIQYSRTITSTHDFEIPRNLLVWNPTCSFSDESLEEIVDRFLQLPNDTDALLTIWGHSYELDAHHTWERLEAVLKTLSSRSDVFFRTNSEVLLHQDNSI